MKVTIKQIAKLSGVSIATVSKVVNHKDERISEETRQRVLAVIKEEGYVPNRIASSMVTRKTSTLGLIIPDITNPFFPELARGVEDRANELGYTVILCNSDDGVAKENLYIKMLQEKMVDGIILTAASDREDIESMQVQSSIPIVGVDRKIKGLKDENVITVDNEQGAFDSVCYMIKRGYKRIVHIAGPMSLEVSRNRYDGFVRGHEVEGVELLPEHLMEGYFTTQWGYTAAKELIDQRIDFDAISCGNDLIAFGVYKALHEARLEMPRDIGVIGYDDIYMSAIVTPALTTVRQPIYQMGKKAASLVIKLIEKKDIKERDYLLKTELVIRDSVK